MNRGCRINLLPAVAACCAVASAAAASDDTGAVFSSFEWTGAPQPQMYLGKEVKEGEYPALFRTSSKNALGEEKFCTSTIVGPDVLLTAAHCLAGKNTITLKQKTGFEWREFCGECEVHPEFSANQSADVAICRLERQISGFDYEVVDLSADWIKIGGEVRMLGYGCITRDIKKKGDGKLREGDTKISALPSGTDYAVTVKGGAALCPGDSGGPTFRKRSNTYTYRRMVSVNSSFDWDTENGATVIAPDLVSYVTPLSTPTIVDFIKRWAEEAHPVVCKVTLADAGAKVCGVTANAGEYGCRE